ncbi:MAG: hypothetical protein ABSH08_15960 [Tepidisphaeraceae bacterium]
MRELPSQSRGAERPPRSLETVNLPMIEAEEKMVKHAMDRGRPLGTEAWGRQKAVGLDVGHTLRPRRGTAERKSERRGGTKRGKLCPL